MRFRFQLLILATLLVVFAVPGWAQTPPSTSSDLSVGQRIEVMRSKLEAMHRSLTSAVSSMGGETNDKEKKNLDDPRERLRGLDKEVNAILTEVNDVRAKQERADKYDHTILDRLEISVAEINTRVEA